MTPPTRLDNVVVAIPTFRRLDLLGKLLSALLPDLHGRGVNVLIGDNECSPEVERLVSSHRSAGHAITYLAVKERGVSQVRNALVAAATSIWPNWRWIAMLDDDGAPNDGAWLETLIGCGVQYDAHLVGGRVVGVLPDDAGALARKSVFVTRRRWPTGPVDTLNTTQNLAISSACIELLGAPLFDPGLGASGGEDYDLFRRASKAGGRLVWCDEATVTEPAPAERLTRNALLDRSYTTGLYMTAIDQRYDGAISAFCTGFKGLTKATLSTVVGMVASNPDLVAQGVLASAHYSGRLAGLAGFTAGRYGR